MGRKSVLQLLLWNLKMQAFLSLKKLGHNKLGNKIIKRPPFDQEKYEIKNNEFAF